MVRTPAGHSGEENTKKATNLTGKSLQGLLVLEEKGTGSEKLETQLKELP